MYRAICAIFYTPQPPYEVRVYIRHIGCELIQADSDLESVDSSYFLLNIDGNQGTGNYADRERLCQAEMHRSTSPV